MSLRLFYLFTAFCGIVGVVTLLSSFYINPTPPSDYTMAQVIEFGKQHRTQIILGAWLQGCGTVLNVVFFLSLVVLSKATNRVAGLLTLFSCGAIMCVSLIEITLYLDAILSGETGDTSAMRFSLNLILAVHHVFLVAPAILLPLGVVLLGSKLLPAIFAYTALSLGVLLQILGFAGLFDALQEVIDVVLIFQEVWLIAVAIYLTVKGIKLFLTRSSKVSDLSEAARLALAEMPVPAGRM